MNFQDNPVGRKHALSTRSWAVLLLPLLLLTGCLHAGRVDEGWFYGRTCFQVPPGWQVERNRRGFTKQWVVMRAPAGDGLLSVELSWVGPGLEHIPPSLLAEVVMSEMGRRLGVDNVALGQGEVMLAGRPAVAVTGVQRQGPRDGHYTALVALVERRLLVVRLQAPTGALGQHSLAMERIMNTLSLPADPPPPYRFESW